MILIVAGNDDVHARCVRSELRQLGKDAVILDTALLGKSILLTQFDGSRSILQYRSPTMILHSDDIEAVWLRRPGRIDLSDAVREDCLEFAVREWRETFWGWLDGLPARFTNPLVSQERATKPLQIRLANEVGLRTPATCITNSADEFSEFAARFDGRVIHKALTQQKATLMDTKAWKPRDRRHLSKLFLVPTMVQERIVGPEDIRLTVIGQRIFGARIRTPAEVVDSRLVQDLPYEAWPPPADLAGKIGRLMDALGLEFGTVDLKVSEEGEPVFLEVNPQGQFIYLEIITGQPLIRSFSKHLAGAA